ncbi:hypothetical protein B0T21DRAFT_417196 [Apiosordaria backusii]|uniref:Uncharacterized protein n=1 Tax=Apiosordaria backusii TaxID=314023 RepID=A0AA39ZPM6_9PEZI|nr:hypothetical protein B0T21DRAFT_417196 [Apiosordaria backusii]
MTTKQKLQKKRKAWKERKKAQRKAARVAAWNASQPGPEADPLNVGPTIPKNGPRPSRNDSLGTQEKLDQIQSQLEKQDIKWSAQRENWRKYLAFQKAQQLVNKQQVALVGKVGNRLWDEINSVKATVEGLKKSRANDWQDVVVEEMDDDDGEHRSEEEEEEELVIPAKK